MLSTNTTGCDFADILATRDLENAILGVDVLHLHLVDLLAHRLQHGPPNPATKHKHGKPQPCWYEEEWNKLATHVLQMTSRKRQTNGTRIETSQKMLHLNV